MTTAQRPARRSFLVPEFDGEVVAATAPIEELLLALANRTDDDPPLSAALHGVGADAFGVAARRDP